MSVVWPLDVRWGIPLDEMGTRDVPSCASAGEILRVKGE